jgi:hypothetical protein
MQAIPRLRIVLSVGSAYLLLAGTPAPATGLAITPDPAVFDLLIGGSDHFKGNIDFVGMVTGAPAGGVVLGGSVGAGDVTLMFTATIDSDSALGMASTNIFPFPVLASSPVFSAVGTIPDGGADVSLQFADSDSAIILYDDPGDFELNPGQTSDTFFLSFSSISVGDQLGFEYVVLPLGTLTVVPEPGALGLLALGACALAGWMRGRLRA